jgi:ketosteroid isomerase-like protein
VEEITATNLWALLLAAASAIVLLVNAVEKVVKIVKAAKAPNACQDARLDALEEWRKIVDGKLNRDNDRLAVIEDGDRAIQRALLALLDHSLDGNNIKQMQDAKTALQDHLINR